MAATLAALEPPAGEPKMDPSKDGREGGKGGGGGGGRAGSGGSEKQMVFKDKKEAMEALKDLLRERNVPSTANWEAAVKAISKDPRYEYLSKLTEKKQVRFQYFHFFRSDLTWFFSPGIQRVQDPAAERGARGGEDAAEEGKRGLRGLPRQQGKK